MADNPNIRVLRPDRQPKFTDLPPFANAQMLANFNGAVYTQRVEETPDSGVRSVVFTCPVDPEGNSVSLELQISDKKDFSNIIESSISHNDETGWSVFDGSGWTPLSEFAGTGLVLPGYQGNRVLYEFTNPDAVRGRLYFIRVRTSDDDGASWSDWQGETWQW